MSRITRVLIGLLATAMFISGCRGVEPYHKPKKDIRMSPDDPVEKICANGLPVIFIDTPDSSEISTKQSWMKHVSIHIVSKDGSSFDGEVKIKGHGNGTWRNYPKKPYTFIFKKPVSILGIEPGRRYVLLANWRDRTLMRNAVAFEISRKTSLAWTPEGRYVEVVLNGQFMGNYYLTEKVNVEAGNLRVPVGENGYLLNFDTGYDKEKGFQTKIKEYPVEVPDWTGRDLSAEEREYVHEYIDGIEDMLYNGSKDWHEYLDLESFCDWYLVQEITGNPELLRPRSSYMYITSDGILHAGPCWDFDYKTFIRTKNRFLFDKTLWFDAFFQDPAFRACLKERWNAIKPELMTDIPKFMDKTRQEIEKSEKLNYKMWPIFGWYDNHDEKLSFDKATEKLKKNYLRRLDAIDKLVNDL